MSDWDNLVEPTRAALEALIRKGDAQANRIEQLEAKLAKAVAVLEVLSDFDNLDTSGGFYDGGATMFSYQARQRYGDFDDIARTTLTELKGQDDE